MSSSTMSKQDAKVESEESNRMWASASFVGVLIIVGLPLWWKTTEVYRVALPYDKISEFESLPITIGSELTVLANDAAAAAEIASAIKKAFEDEEIIKLKIKKAVLPDDLHRTLDSVADEQEAIEDLGSKYDLEDHNAFYVVQRRHLAHDVWLAGERVLFFRDGKASPTIIQALKQWVYQVKVLQGAVSGAGDAHRRARTPPGRAAHILLSVPLPSPQQLTVEFDAEAAVEDYIGSFVDELSVLHNFTLKSQWLYMFDFDFKAKEVKDNSEWGRHFAVSQHRLQQLLTRLEARAGAHLTHTTLHLALYAPPCRHTPLLISHPDTEHPINSPVQAFMSPQWGGVILGGASAAECAQERPAWRPNVRLVMGTFVAQLRRLLGIIDMPPIPGAYLQPLRSVAPRRWEVDALLRIRTAEQIASAKRTLLSLAQLLGEISNIVINDEVGASITGAVGHIAAGGGLAARGALVPAYAESLRAHEAAETAFMEPSLLALLYFPDDQKYAIYIPLFLPIMFPVVLSLKNLYLWFRGKPVHKDKAE